MRHEYCLARIAIEDAKILDKKGDHYSSSEKYDSAADAFEKMGQELGSEQDRKELRLIISLSRAWQKMTLAEAESSSALYLEASQLFEQVKEFSPNEKTKMLVLGHSRFCKALEAGTRFADSRDAALHQIVEQHLESAANYYVRAGFQNASEYSKAIEHLFDAYLYMDDAKKEKDPEKKARLYIMAEKVLQTSAGSFMKAEHPEKTEQVQRLLEKVKEERELALSLSEVFHAPSIVSTTAAFNTPGPTHENAVGLEKFEHADVHANIIVDRNELKVGETLDLEIELANVGKGTALLDKIEGAIPNGFEIAEKLQTYRIEGCNVNMKGRRLEQLKGEDVKFSLRPKHKGSFTLRPVILYLDENGNAKSHEPEPVIITVKELGIKGWIKGER
jgi:tetratricopeptide (TPR) repeat protein